MLRKISELDFDEVIARIQRSVNRATRHIGEPVLQREIDTVRSPADAIEIVRGHVSLAIAKRLRMEEIRVTHPLVRAIVRCQHHPEPCPIEAVGSVTEAIAERLNQIVSENPALEWDPAAVQQLLIDAIRQYGEHELDDEQRPGLMYWGPASPAATALIALVALRELGDL